MASQSRSMVFGIAGFGAVAALVAALVPRGAVVPPTPAAPPGRDTVATRRAAPYHGGHDLLAAFLGSDASAGADRPYDLDVLIATLPDPVESHLDWAYDSELEAIRRAYERSGFVIDRFWLPRTDVVAEGTKPMGNSVPEREVAPGVFLFRSTVSDKQLRLLYVVGEVPTSGIHKAAFAAALAERALLLEDRRFLHDVSAQVTLRLLAPSFSGSAVSLRRALVSWLATSAGQRIDSIVVVTGSATSREVRTTLNLSKLRFHATVNSDDRLDEGLRAALTCLGVKGTDVALVREATTQYGALLRPVVMRQQAAEVTHNRDAAVHQRDAAGPTTPADRLSQSSPCLAHPLSTDSTVFLDVPFPMNIGSVRTEYARHPETQTGATPMPVPVAEQSVPLSLEDLARPQETPPPTSPLTTAAAELIIDQIAKTLNDHHIRFAGILATDVRDKLFLASEIRRRVPNIQLFTYESNILYARPDYDQWLHGMLVFSTYPLVPENQLTLGERQQVSFSNDGAEGVYNAALVLLGRVDAVTDYDLPRPTDTTRHADSTRRPPVWVTAVGHGRMVSLVALPAAAGADQYLQRAPALSRDTPQAPPVGGELPMAAMLLVGLGTGLLALWSLKQVPGASGETVPPMKPGTGPGKTPGAATWTAVEREVLAAALEVHIQAYNALLLVTLGTLLPPATVVTYQLAARYKWPTIVVAAVLIALVLLWAYALLRHFVELARLLIRHRVAGWRYLVGRWGTLRERLRWRVEFAARSLVVLLGIGYAYLTWRFAFRIWILHAMQSADYELFYRRAVQIVTGVSPLAPLLLSGIGFAGWCLWHLRRVADLRATTAFEAAGRHGALDERLAKTMAETRSRLFYVIPERNGLFCLAVLALFILWLAPQFGQTLEDLALPTRRGDLSAFDLLLRYGVVAALVSTPWATYRVAVVWRSLRRTLAVLVETPLVEAFDRLPRRVADVSRLSPFSSRQSALIDAHSANLLRQLRQIYHDQSTTFARLLKDEPDQLKSIQTLAAQRDEAVAVPGARTSTAVGTALVPVYETLRRDWRRARSGSAIDSIAAEAANNTTDGTAVLLHRGGGDTVRLWLRMAEDLAALQVADYVDWVIGQIRNLAGFLLLALALTTLLLSSYPFQPQAAVKLVFAFEVAGTITMFLFVLSQMNRDDALSRIAKTEPGELTWNTTFVINLLLFVALPLVTLLSAQVPVVGGTIFAWVGPLLRAFTKS